MGHCCGSLIKPKQRGKSSSPGATDDERRAAGGLLSSGAINRWRPVFRPACKPNGPWRSARIRPLMYREPWRWWSLSWRPGRRRAGPPTVPWLAPYQQIDKRQPLGLVVGFSQQLPIAMEVKTRVLITHLMPPRTLSRAKCSSSRERAQEPRAKGGGSLGFTFRLQLPGNG